jgi:carboxymethylenebutenolidase
MITQDIIRLYDAFTHGQIARRDFLTRLAVLAGSMAAAQQMLPLLENDYTTVASGNPQTEGVQTEYITYPGASGEMRA